MSAVVAMPGRASDSDPLLRQPERTGRRNTYPGACQRPAMEKYVRWFAKLGRFYQILVALALFVGLAAVGTGVGTSNPAFLAVGAFWLLVAPAVVWLATRQETDPR